MHLSSRSSDGVGQETSLHAMSIPCNFSSNIPISQGIETVIPFSKGLRESNLTGEESTLGLPYSRSFPFTNSSSQSTSSTNTTNTPSCPIPFEQALQDQSYEQDPLQNPSLQPNSTFNPSLLQAPPNLTKQSHSNPSHSPNTTMRHLNTSFHPPTHYNFPHTLQNPQNPQNPQNLQNIQNTQNPQNIQSTQNLQNVQNMQNTQYTPFPHVVLNPGSHFTSQKHIRDALNENPLKESVLNQAEVQAHLAHGSTFFNRSSPIRGRNSADEQYRYDRIKTIWVQDELAKQKHPKSLSQENRQTNSDSFYSEKQRKTPYSAGNSFYSDPETDSSLICNYCHHSYNTPTCQNCGNTVDFGLNVENQNITINSFQQPPKAGPVELTPYHQDDFTFDKNVKDIFSMCYITATNRFDVSKFSTIIMAVIYTNPSTVPQIQNIPSNNSQMISGSNTGTVFFPQNNQ
jgi:hypothetical protein